MIKLLSLFSGIGAFEKALKNQDIPFELVNYCEFDKHASKSYSLIHKVPESKNLGDITKVDVSSLPGVDFVCYGFPCQDISISGNTKGFFNEDGTHTRSGLFFDALGIIRHCKPKIAIAENVKNLTSKMFSEQFKIVLDSLENAGYNNYWKVLNSKDFGIPQNRERVFIVSIRKDIDTGRFEFPEPYELKLRLKDLLEDDADEIVEQSKIQPLIHVDGDQVNIRTNNSKGFEEVNLFEDAVDYTQPNSKTRRGRVQHGLSQTLTTYCKQGIVVDKTVDSLKIRRLSTKEYFRLQGFDDCDHDVCLNGGISKQQLYKQAGNSITVDVLEELFCMMFDERGDLYV